MENKQMTIIPKGTLLTFLTGWHNGQKIFGIFEAMKELDSESLKNEFEEYKKTKIFGIDFNDYGFLKLVFLMQKGYIEKIDESDPYKNGFLRNDDNG